MIYKLTSCWNFSFFVLSASLNCAAFLLASVKSEQCNVRKLKSPEILLVHQFAKINAKEIQN